MLNGIRITKELVLLGIAVFLVLTVIFSVIVSFFLQSPEQQAGSIPTPTPYNILTKEEETYPQATPQPFRRERLQPGEQAQFGTLVVTSEPEDVIVLIDATTHRNWDDPIKDQQWPLNTTPFTVSPMPVGTHYLLARKNGYVMAEETYVIKPNEVTRVHVKLLPL